MGGVWGGVVNLGLGLEPDSDNVQGSDYSTAVSNLFWGGMFDVSLDSPSSPVRILPHDAETIRWPTEILSGGGLAAGDPAEGAIMVESSTGAVHDGPDEGSDVPPKPMRAEVPVGPEGACSSVGIPFKEKDEEERENASHLRERRFSG